MKQKLINWGAGILLVSALITFIYNSVESHSADQRFRKIIQSQLELQNHKADSIYARQALFEKAIEKLRSEINDGQMVVREIEREKTKVYNNYINQVSEFKPDSTIERYYPSRATRFDSLLINGFFFRQ